MNVNDLRIRLLIEVRDPYIASHQQRVSTLVCAIAQEMGLSKKQIERLRLAATIHDIGMTYIPAEILGKSAPLSEIEMQTVKTHPLIGYELLSKADFPRPVPQIVLQHHEKMDGSGYPRGISGDAVLLEARILAVADVVEAMVSYRPYRPPRGIGEALEEILHNKGVLYDPGAVNACLMVFTEKRFKFE